MKKSIASKSLASFTATVALAFIFPVASSFAHTSPSNPKAGFDTYGNALQPAPRYNGVSPIDMKNGLFFDNGTFGLPNEDIEAWSKSLEAVGISERTYPFDQRQRFIDAYADRVTFFQTALENWSQTTSETLPEAAAYAKEATATITPKFDKLKDVLGQIRGASASNWDAAQGDARRALADAQSTYYGMHHNPAKK